MSTRPGWAPRGAGSRAAELHRSERHRDRGLGRVDHRDAERLLQRSAMARHAGTTHHQCLGAVLLLQVAPDIDHALERLFAACRLGDRHVERTLPGKAVHEPHLEQIALVPGDRTLADGNDAEAPGAGERGEDAEFGNAEYRPHGALATYVEARIAVASDHERVRGVIRLHHAAQRHDDAFDVGLSLNSKWTFRKGEAHDLRTVRKPQRLKCRIETSGDGLI